MKKTTKFISAFMAAILCFNLVSFSAFAAEPSATETSFSAADLATYRHRGKKFREGYPARTVGSPADLSVSRTHCSREPFRRAEEYTQYPRPQVPAGVPENPPAWSYKAPVQVQTP